MEIPFSSKLFTCEHLFSNDSTMREVGLFECRKNENLEHYIQDEAFDDEKTGASRTYIIRDIKTQEIAAYFTLRCGMLTFINNSKPDSFDVIPAIELGNIAINDVYKDNHLGEYTKDFPLGLIFFVNFIHPIATFIANYIGAQSIYLFSINNDKVITNYSKWGFSRLGTVEEAYLTKHIQSFWEEDCIFMSQTIN